MTRLSGQKLIRSAFVHMMVVNMFVLVSSSVCGFMDNVIVGRLLGTEALAAVGYFSPVMTAVGLFNTIVLSIRVVAQNELTIRIRDNCPEFDPRKRVEVFDPKSPEKNIGIRLTTGLARQVDYYNNAGVNTLLIKM